MISTLSDAQLLASFTRDASADAFGELVRRHIDMVYAAARRQLRDPHEAQDVTQAAFIVLARRAHTIRHAALLPAWLLKVTHFAAANTVKTAARRRKHEEARAMSIETAILPGDPEWEKLSPHLDAALSRLSEVDRAALIAHCVHHQSIAEVAAALHLSEPATRKRIQRALERLRALLTPHSTLASIAIPPLLAAHMQAAAPAGLSSVISTAALAASHSAAAGAGMAAAHAAIRMLLWTKVRMVVAGSLGVALIGVTLGVGVTHMLYPTVSASPPPITAAPATAPSVPVNPVGYNGWIHVTYSDPKDHILDWNSQTHARAERYERAQRNQSPANTQIEFEDPVQGEIFDYHSTNATIRRGFFQPFPYGSEFSAPPTVVLTMPALIAELHAAYPEGDYQIKQSSEGSLDRYDIQISESAPAKRIHFGIYALSHYSQNSLPPSQVMVDRKTGLFQQAIISDKKETYTYGDPAIHTIYDAGAPKGARVYDNRETPETLTIYDRVMAHARKEFPDGVTVKLTTEPDNTDLLVCTRAGAHWEARGYPVARGPSDVDKLQLPENWQTDGADELFRRLALLMPSGHADGDGKIVTERYYNKVSGEPYYEWNGFGLVIHGRDPDLNSANRGPRVTTGTSAIDLARQYSPSYWLSPQEAMNGRWSLGGHLDVITSDRLQALRTQTFGATPETAENVYENIEEWIDPTQNDRPVLYKTTLTNPSTHEAISETSTLFSNYAKLPAPDSRSYPTSWTTTYYEPGADKALAAKEHSVTQLYFFPGRTLGELPKKPN
ncbi:MAG TPA: RNA polymerase sigma factor [Phycisphaerae bacterium]|jgi:RNA polymerase sigma factor (sigma-70 family)